MSKDVHYKGQLKKIELNGMTVEEKAKELLGQLELEVYYDSYVEKLCDGDDYIILDDELYGIHNLMDVDDTDVFNSTMRSDGLILFEVKYYNGGCGLSEAIETAYDNMRD